VDGSRQQSPDGPGSERRVAARAVLAGDGRSWVLQPWQVAYLIDVAEGREGVVPPGCGVGKGWLDERLREAFEARHPTDRR
jgi:hypothetical protein